MIFAIQTNVCLYSVTEISLTVFNAPPSFTEAAQTILILNSFTEAAQTILVLNSFLVHYKDAREVNQFSHIKAGLK